LKSTFTAHPIPKANHDIVKAAMLLTTLIVLMISGCATYPGWLSSTGPSGQQVEESQESERMEGIRVIDIDDTVARRLLSFHKKMLFSDAFTETAHSGYVIGPGDVIEVSVWEAPPSMLFGGEIVDPRSRLMTTTSATTFPEQMISSEGMITIPFAGKIATSGKTLEQVEAQIAKALKGRANQPQVLVRLIHNNTANVTVMGEVNKSMRMPLTAGRERLLDAVATAGGVRESISKMSLQLTRGDQMRVLPLDIIIRDPQQNIALQPGDVVTALFQPLSFTALGAAAKNGEINFETKGISLAQALARAGGLDDTRADARAVFIFRLEDVNTLDWDTPPKTNPDGKVPVIYQLNLKHPASFFVAQSFPVDNEDVLYISNAPVADLQKLLNIATSVTYPFMNSGSIGHYIKELK
jgi:polysaccharide export outer membrane protein